MVGGGNNGQNLCLTVYWFDRLISRLFTVKCPSNKYTEKPILTNVVVFYIDLKGTCRTEKKTMYVFLNKICYCCKGKQFVFFGILGMVQVVML